MAVAAVMALALASPERVREPEHSMLPAGDPGKCVGKGRYKKSKRKNKIAEASKRGNRK